MLGSFDSGAGQTLSSFNPHIDLGRGAVAYTSEIDKLEARFRDNPKGRNFAPLADAYRKAGLIDNAVDLCQNGLKLHPDYVSAYIVYARCLVDKKDDAGALGVFRKVLELDGENIIALRGLAELAERNGKYEEEVELNPQQIEQVEIEGLARTQYEGSGMFKLDAPEPTGRGAGSAPDLDEALPQVDLPLIMPDDEIETPASRAPQRPRAAPPPT